jgi:signal transduction histidine kinase
MLATIGLHLETLQRLSGPGGTRAANAALALLVKATTLCNRALIDARKIEARAQRRSADVGCALAHAIEVLAPTFPEGLAIDVAAGKSVAAMVDPNDLFRILFNLLHNAVTVAQTTGELNRIAVGIEAIGKTVTISIADNGPGLPPALRRQCFRPGAAPAGDRVGGFGIAIARELAERSGGVLKLMPSDKGTAFALTLPVFAEVVRARRALNYTALRRAAGS